MWIDQRAISYQPVTKVIITALYIIMYIAIFCPVFSDIATIKSFVASYADICLFTVI